MQKILLSTLLLVSFTAYASDIIPLGHQNNTLYYRIGGSSDFALPPLSNTHTTVLNSHTNLGIGYSCSAYNPALSIMNSINDLKDSADNLEQTIIASATGSLIQLPMYFLAQANPTAYHLLNSTLLAAHQKLEVSTKSCEAVKDQIAKGQNPYQDWGTISLNDQWKKHLTFISSGNEDINASKKEIERHSGEDGVPWVQGTRGWDTGLRAGGKAQPPIHVIADTVRAGYNTLLHKEIDDQKDMPNDSSLHKEVSNQNNIPHDSSDKSELELFFPDVESAMTWITSVVGDHIITTCNDESCKKNQGSLVGYGLLPKVTSCEADKNNCSDTIRDNLSNLVAGNTTLTKDALTKVSAEGIVISPDVIASIQNMDTLQQKIIIHKLAQEIALQRVMDKAFIARTILTTGAQVPVIAANHPAEVMISHALTHLDNDIRALAFESQMRKQMMSETLSETLKFSTAQQHDVMQRTPVSSSTPLIENAALPLPKESSP
jgi:integrating conjugative element protein (TIGR03755 family)